MLQPSLGAKSAGEINVLVKDRIAAWRNGEYGRLFDEARGQEQAFMAEFMPKKKRGRKRTRGAALLAKTEAQKREVEFSDRAREGKVTAAYRYACGDSDVKPVMPSEPGRAAQVNSKFPEPGPVLRELVQRFIDMPSADLPPFEPVLITEDDILEACGTHHQGAAGLNGVDQESFAQMMTGCGDESAKYHRPYQPWPGQWLRRTSSGISLSPCVLAEVRANPVYLARVVRTS
jgi:hypothetical protein